MSKQELEELVEELDKIKGQHTELITVYIPGGQNLNTVKKQMEDEKGTAENIKSKQTRKNVISALDTIGRDLKNYKKTPENGMAIFCGNVSESEGRTEIQLWVIEPPQPLNTRLYRCDKEFVLEPLKKMLEAEEVYGLVVMDRKEATLGLLEGKHVKVLRHMTSGVPGKQRAGGQCLSPDTLVMKHNGELIELRDSHNPLIIQSENFNEENSEETPIISKWENKKQLYEIKTCYPKFQIKSSKDHLFFIRTEKGIEEMPLSEIREGDFLVMPEKIKVKGKKQKIKSKKYYNSFSITEKGRGLLKDKRKEKNLFQKELAEKSRVDRARISAIELGKINAKRHILKKICHNLRIDYESFIEKYTEPYKYSHIKLPSEINEEFARFLGYYFWDGNDEKDRISLFEQRKKVALKYKRMIDLLFEIDSNYRFRESKNYHQIRITSRPLVRLIREEFSEISNALNSKIPKKILKSPNDILSAFISGFYDAEGYVSSGRIGLGVNNKKVIRQLQISLLRFGIISSILEYNNKRNPYSDEKRYTLAVDDKKSLKIFRDKIGFISKKKMKKLNELINKRSKRNKVRQLVVNGRDVARILRNSGCTTTQFSNPLFFVNKRQLSKELFRENIVDKIKWNDLKKRLLRFYNSNLIAVKISSIKKIRESETIDIETKNHNFIANGLIVHNSSQRFERLTEGMAKRFYKRVAEAMKKAFFKRDRLKGIILGGPVPTKEDFLKEGHLITALKDKVIGTKDIGNADEQGLEDLVEASKDLLEEQEIIHEKNLLEKFFERIGKGINAVYKEKEVEKALKYGAVETLILSKKLKKQEREKMKKKAEDISAEVEIVSTDTEEGQQFWNMTGIGALLRFKV